MRHRKSTTKLGRKSGHRRSLIANQVCSLILHERIRTTLAKAKAVRPIAEKMVTLGKSGTLHDRRNAAAFLLQKDAVKKLFSDIAPRCADRKGGYTRIIKLGQRFSDAAPMAYLEWVDGQVGAPADAAPPKKVSDKGKKSQESLSSESESIEPSAKESAPPETAEVPKAKKAAKKKRDPKAE